MRVDGEHFVANYMNNKSKIMYLLKFKNNKIFWNIPRGKLGNCFQNCDLKRLSCGVTNSTNLNTAKVVSDISLQCSLNFLNGGV